MKSMPTTNRLRVLAPLGVVALLVVARPTQAQWITQTNILRPGWNAVYLHVDPSHTNINGLVRVTDPIEEIWLWNPELPPGQAVATPPSPGGSQWSTWRRNEGPASVLQTLRGNFAMLVRVSSGMTSFEWRVKGKPVAPSYLWTLTGLNFVGFASATPAPTFRSFLAPDPQPLDWGQSAEVFRYEGGDLTTNPIQVTVGSIRDTMPVPRDQAYWIRTDDLYNQYFGPFQATGAGSSSIRLGDSSGQTRLRLKNMTRGNLTITLRQVASETPPPGQRAIAPGLIPLLVRGPINTTNLTFGYSNLTTGTYLWTLTPKGQVGSETEVILGANRSAMTGSTNDYAGVLRFTDSLGLTRVDIGVAAAPVSRRGLWVGSASVEYVSQYLKPYAKATNEADFQALLNRLQLGQGVNGFRYEWDTNTGRVLVFGGPQNRTGSYLLDGPIKLDSGGVARPFPLRLIVHNTGTSAGLLQQAYLGIHKDSSNLVVATRESELMTSQLASARRVSAVHLPLIGGNPWSFSGTIQDRSTLTTTVTHDYDDHTSNPFLHTYHPDHDNLDALYKTEENPGRESFGIRRLISLEFAAPSNDFESLTKSGSTLTGNYRETVTFLDRHGDSKQFNVLGNFRLSRLTDIAALTP